MKKTTLSGIIIGVAALLTLIAVIILVGNSSPAKKAAKQLDLGYKFLSAEEYDEAIAAFERAIEIAPNNMEAYLGPAKVYFDDRGLVIEFAKDAEINIIKFYNSQGGFFISADHHY